MRVPELALTFPRLEVIPDGDRRGGDSGTCRGWLTWRFRLSLRFRAICTSCVGSIPCEVDRDCSFVPSALDMSNDTSRVKRELLSDDSPERRLGTALLLSTRSCPSCTFLFPRESGPLGGEPFAKADSSRNPPDLRVRRPKLLLDFLTSSCCGDLSSEVSGSFCGLSLLLLLFPELQDSGRELDWPLRFAMLEKPTSRTDDVPAAVFPLLDMTTADDLPSRVSSADGEPSWLHR